MGEFQAKDSKYYLDKISKYKFECGCKLGAIFFAIALIFFIVLEIYLHTIKNSLDISYSRVNLYGAIFVFGSALLGKIVGIGTAKIKLKLLLVVLACWVL